MKKILLYLTLVGVLSTSTLQAGWIEAQKFLTQQATPSSSYGYSLDIDGRYAVVGAPNEDGGRGRVYIFKKDANDDFQAMQTIHNLAWSFLSTTYYNALGTDVAVSDGGGNNVKIVVGAPDTYNIFVERIDYDSVVIFDLNANSNQFDLSYSFEENNNSGAGQSVDIALVEKSAIDNGIPHIIPSGFVVVTGLAETSQIKTYAYESNSHDWTTTTVTNPLHVGSEDRFGDAIALREVSTPLLLDNKIKLVVGAPNVDINGRANRGRAYVYDLNGDFGATGLVWNNEAVLEQYEGILTVNTHFNLNTYFGSAVDIHNNRIIIGSKKQNISSDFIFAPVIGEAQVYEMTNVDQNEWSKLGRALHGSGVTGMYDKFGISVAIENDIAIVGASGQKNASGEQRGALYSFQIDDTDTWNETGVVIGEVGGNLGYSVGIQDAMPMVGNPNDDSVSRYKFQTESSTSTSPAIIMYLLN